MWIAAKLSLIHIFDLGQNASLMPRLTVQGSAGARVKIVPTELLKADGSADDTMCGLSLIHI